jgi:hypothetical protein
LRGCVGAQVDVLEFDHGLGRLKAGKRKDVLSGASKAARVTRKPVRRMCAIHHASAKTETPAGEGGRFFHHDSRNRL